MRVAWSIKAKISLLVLLLGLLLIVINQLRNEKLLAERSIARIEREAGETGTRLAGMMQHLFRKEQQRAAELEMSYASISTDLELGLVCDHDDVVRYSTRLQWRGLNLKDTPLVSAARHVVSSRGAMDGISIWDAEHVRLLAVFPFFTSFDSKDRGVVVLAYDSSYALERARGDAVRETVVQACLLASVCMLLWFLLDLLVARRVELVLNYSRAVKAGTEPPTPLRGADELAAIAQSFAETVGKMHETESLLMEASEAERRRIGRDIHDDVCQRLAAAQLKSGVLSSELTEEKSVHAALAENIAVELREAASVTRMFARGLAPVWVEKEGLAPALHELAAHLARSFEIQCKIECDLGNMPPAVWVQTHVFRIVQELATNAAKHAHAKNVRVSLSVAFGMLRLEVENDGLSFNRAEEARLGMLFLRQRVRALGGKLTFQARASGAAGTLALCEARLAGMHFSDQHKDPS